MIGWGDFRPAPDTLAALDADPRVRISATGSHLDAEPGGDSDD